MLGICWCGVKSTCTYYTKNNQEVKRSLWYLNFFCKKYIATYIYNITRVCILVIICHLTSFGSIYLLCMPASTTSWLILLNIVYLPCMGWLGPIFGIFHDLPYCNHSITWHTEYLAMCSHSFDLKNSQFSLDHSHF